MSDELLSEILNRIVIDLVPIRVGEGGTGSGIWTYARELLHSMDQMVPNGLEVLALVNEGQVPYLQLKHIRLKVFPEQRKNILKRLFWVHLQLPLWCLRNQIDVLHKVATETPWFCTAKRVTTIHDFYYEYLVENHPSESVRLYESLESTYFAFITRLCFKKSRQIIAVSEATRQEALQRQPDCEDQITTIHHGAPRVNSEPNAECRMSNANSFNILCVAKFMEHKGQHLLIAAFELLMDEHEELRGKVNLALRGFHNDGDYYQRVSKMISLSPAHDGIHIVPYNPVDSAQDIYGDADLVALLSAYEGFGLPVLEAQSHGIPVVCSDLAVLRETGGDGATYVDRNDAERVAGVLYKYVNDRGFYEQMKKRAVENTTRFSWDNAARETVSVYQEALQANGSIDG